MLVWNYKLRVLGLSTSLIVFFLKLKMT